MTEQKHEYYATIPLKGANGYLTRVDFIEKTKTWLANRVSNNETLLKPVIGLTDTMVYVEGENLIEDGVLNIGSFCDINLVSLTQEQVNQTVSSYFIFLRTACDTEPFIYTVDDNFFRTSL